MEQLQRENEKLGGQDSDPHQGEGDASSPIEEDEEEARRRKRDSLQTWKGQIIQRQIEEAMKGD